MAAVIQFTQTPKPRRHARAGIPAQSVEAAKFARKCLDLYQLRPYAGKVIEATVDRLLAETYARMEDEAGD